MDLTNLLLWGYDPTAKQYHPLAVNADGKLYQLPGNFLDLGDTPASYSGKGGNVPVVNPGENALEFKPRYFQPAASGDIEASCTSVTWSGLDLDSARCYLLLLALEEGSGSDCMYNMYFNDDETDTNYQTRKFRIYGTNDIDRYVFNNPTVAMNLAGMCGFWHCTIMRGSSKPIFHSIGHRQVASDAIHERYDFTGGWEISSNVTKIKIKASQTDGIAAGSRLLLFKVA